MQRSITVPFHSGSITFTASFDNPNSEKDHGYLLDDSLKRGGVVTFEQVIPKLNHLCRHFDEQEQAGTTNVTASGSTEIDGIIATVMVVAELNRADMDVDLVKDLLKCTVVRDTLGYLVEMASTPELPESIGDLLANLIGGGHGHVVSLGDLLGGRTTRGGEFAGTGAYL